MRKILTLVPVNSFFANAGQSVTERATISALANSGKYTVKAVCIANDSERCRFEDYYRSEISRGVVEYVSFPWTDPAILLSDVDAILLHSLPNQTFTRKLMGDRVWLSRPTLHFVHSFAATYMERVAWATFWCHWRGAPACRLLCPSLSAANRVRTIQDLVRTFGGELPEVVVAPPAISVDMYRNGKRDRGRSLLQCPQETNIVLCLARLTPKKLDHRQLIEAAAVLNERLNSSSKLHLVFAGGVAPECEEYVNQLRMLGYERRVTLSILEHVSEDVKIDLLSAADVFVSPAAHPQESFGLALVEAMAAGLPVVASDWNGYREVLPPAYKPYLVPTIADKLIALSVSEEELVRACTVDFRSLVNTLELLLRDKSLRVQLAQEGRLHASRFRHDESTARLLSILDDLLSEQASGRATLPSSPPLDELNTPVDTQATKYLSENSKVQRGLRSGRFTAAEAVVMNALQPGEISSLARLTPLFGGDRFSRNLTVLSLARSGFLEISGVELVQNHAVRPNQ